eukprot:5211175-Amphidinium_carterae.2
MQVIGICFLKALYGTFCFYCKEERSDCMIAFMDGNGSAATFVHLEAPCCEETLAPSKEQCEQLAAELLQLGAKKTLELPNVIEVCAALKHRR